MTQSIFIDTNIVLWVVKGSAKNFSKRVKKCS